MFDAPMFVKASLLRVWHTKLAIELTNNIALQAPRDLAFAFALGATFDHIALCGFVIAHSGDGNAGIGLTVTTAVQAHSNGFAA